MRPRYIINERSHPAFFALCRKAHPSALAFMLDLCTEEGADRMEESAKLVPHAVPRDTQRMGDLAWNMGHHAKAATPIPGMTPAGRFDVEDPEHDARMAEVLRELHEWENS